MLPVDEWDPTASMYGWAKNKNITTKQVCFKGILGGLEMDAPQPTQNQVMIN